MVVNLQWTFVNILRICKHLWPIQSRQLSLHILVQVGYFVQPDLDESPARYWKRKIKVFDKTDFLFNLLYPKAKLETVQQRAVSHSFPRVIF